MRKNMENKLEDLTNKKREISGQNASLKSKLETLKKLEKEMFIKLVNIEEKSKQKMINLDNELLLRSRERNELQATNHMQLNEMNIELTRNIELEYTLTSGKKLDDMKQEEFENQMTIYEAMIKEKINSYETLNKKIKETENKSNEEPYFKTEVENNVNYKKKIEHVEREIMEITTQIQCLEMTNEFLIKKKEDVISERKKLIFSNDDFKREIEAKSQLYEIRIQKQVKSNNSEEIKKLQDHLDSVNNKINELIGKIEKEMEKTKIFTAEIIKLNIDLRHKEEMRVNVIESVDSKIKELTALRDHCEDLKKGNNDLKEKVNKYSYLFFRLERKQQITNYYATDIKSSLKNTHRLTQDITTSPRTMILPPT
jgi:hypothetical protein